MRPPTRRRLREAVARRAGAKSGNENLWGETSGRQTFARCGYCGITIVISWGVGEEPRFWCIDGSEVHLDHIIPETRNGPTSLDNTVLSCAPCNLAKRARPFGDPDFQRWVGGRRWQVLRRSLPDSVELALQEFEREMEAA